MSLIAFAMALGGLLLAFTTDGGTDIAPRTGGGGASAAAVMLEASVLVVIVIPLMRPVGLAVRWARMRDFRFAAAAAGVVVVMITALLLK